MSYEVQMTILDLSMLRPIGKQRRLWSFVWLQLEPYADVNVSRRRAGKFW